MFHGSGEHGVCVHWVLPYAVLIDFLVLFSCILTRESPQFFIYFDWVVLNCTYLGRFIVCSQRPPRYLSGTNLCSRVISVCVFSLVQSKASVLNLGDRVPLYWLLYCSKVSRLASKTETVCWTHFWRKFSKPLESDVCKTRRTERALSITFCSQIS